MSLHNSVRFSDMVQNINVRVDDPSKADVDRYVGLEHLDPESLRIRRWGTPDEVEATKLRFWAGDIVFGRRRFYQRKIAVADFEGICSAHAMVLRAKPDVVLPDFLPFFMQSELFYERAMSISVGSLSPTINWSALARQEFSLPPLSEQRRIADLLWAAEDAIERYRASLAKLEKYHDVFVAHHFALAAQTEQNIVLLGGLGEVAYGLTVNGARSHLPNTMPYLRVANVSRGQIDLADLKTIGIESGELERYRLKRNDVLIVEGHADANEIGRAAVWVENIDPCLHQNHLIRVRCHDDVNPFYVCAYLNSPKGRSYFRRMAQNTSGLNTVNSTVVKRTPIPHIPLEQQNIFVNMVAQIEESQSAVIEHVSSTLELKTSLLAELI